MKQSKKIKIKLPTFIKKKDPMAEYKHEFKLGAANGLGSSVGEFVGEIACTTIATIGCRLLGVKSKK